MSSKKFGFEKASLGGRIKQIRTDRNLTQQAFAASLKTSAGFISEIESGKRAPGSEFMFSFLRVFSVNLNWLLTGEGDIFTTSPAPADAEAREPLIQRIADLLKDMDEERKRDILRYIEKEKLLMELEHLRKK